MLQTCGDLTAERRTFPPVLRDENVLLGPRRSGSPRRASADTLTRGFIPWPRARTWIPGLQVRSRSQSGSQSMGLCFSLPVSFSLSLSVSLSSPHSSLPSALSPRKKKTNAKISLGEDEQQQERRRRPHKVSFERWLCLLRSCY